MVKIKLLLLTIIMTASIFAQDVKVLAKTDSSNYVVGDYINYNLEISRTENIKIIMPSVKDSIKVLEFIEKSDPIVSQKDDRIIENYKFTFSYYDSTEVLIPSFKIRYKIKGDSTLYTVATNELFVFIDKVEVNPEKEIMDIKKPLLVPYNFLVLGIIILVFIAILIVAYFIYKYYKKKKLLADGNAPEVIIPPYEEAIESLHVLESKELWQNGAIKEYHSEITFILRRYFERRFEVPALEMPSSELLLEMRNNKELGEVFDKVRDFFNNADMVKFAKFIPMNTVNEEMMKQAYTVIEKTKPAEQVEDLPKEADNV